MIKSAKEDFGSASELFEHNDVVLIPFTILDVDWYTGQDTYEIERGDALTEEDLVSINTEEDLENNAGHGLIAYQDDLQPHLFWILTFEN